MGRPRSNELARSGHTDLGEESTKNRPDPPETQTDASMGPVPPENLPGHEPDTDPDKPLAKFAERFPAGSEPDEEGDEGPDDRDSPATVANQLRFGAGFTEAEQPGLLDLFQSLDARLATFTAGDTDLELSVKERGRHTQQMTLECWISGRPRLVATSSNADFEASLVEVRDDLRRQLNDAKTRQEPRNSRERRKTIPAPD